MLHGSFAKRSRRSANLKERRCLEHDDYSSQRMVGSPLDGEDIDGDEKIGPPVPQFFLPDLDY